MPPPADLAKKVQALCNDYHNAMLYPVGYQDRKDAAAAVAAIVGLLAPASDAGGCDEAELYNRGYDLMGAADISEYLALCAAVGKYKYELVEKSRTSPDPTADASRAELLRKWDEYRQSVEDCGHTRELVGWANRLADATETAGEWNAAIEALRPFAALLQGYHDHMPDDRPVFDINGAIITVGDLRRAVRALARGGKRGEGR